MKPEDLVIVGEVNGIHGVRGWVKVFSYTRARQSILDYSPWYVEVGGEWCCYEEIEGRSTGKGIIVALPGYRDRDEARRLIGSRVGIRRSQLPELQADEFYWADIIGLEVETGAGETLGRVTGLIETGAKDVLVVRGRCEHLIPFVKDVYILDVDYRRGRVKADWDPSYD